LSRVSNSTKPIPLLRVPSRITRAVFGFKSPNILLASVNLESSEVAKVSDFGLSGARLTISNAEVANPRWLAPEIMNKQEFTEASDVYSYGVILWELLTRETFFSDISFNYVIAEKVMAGKRPPIPDCPPNYRSLIEMCWAQNPKERPTFKDIKIRLGDQKKQISKSFLVQIRSSDDLRALEQRGQLRPLNEKVSLHNSMKDVTTSQQSTIQITEEKHLEEGKQLNQEEEEAEKLKESRGGTKVQGEQGKTAYNFLESLGKNLKHNPKG